MVMAADDVARQLTRFAGGVFRRTCHISCWAQSPACRSLGPSSNEADSIPPKAQRPG